MPGCPPGLQYLTMVDQLLIKQKVEILEAVTGFETANKYEVLNSLGQNVGKSTWLLSIPGPKPLAQNPETPKP